MSVDSFDPLDLLMTEHRLIERSLDSLATCMAELSAGAAIERSDLAAYVEFIQRYADAGHHAKEEDVLFDVMLRSGFPAGGGPIAVMLAEHDQGRAITTVLAESAAAEASGPWSPDEPPRLLDAAAALRGHLRQHIVKEDRILYPLARQHLPPAAMAEVTERIAAFQADWLESGEPARIEAAVASLAERFPPPPSEG